MVIIVIINGFQTYGVVSYLCVNICTYIIALQNKHRFAIV